MMLCMAHEDRSYAHLDDTTNFTKAQDLDEAMAHDTNDLLGLFSIDMATGEPCRTDGLSRNANDRKCPTPRRPSSVRSAGIISSQGADYERRPIHAGDGEQAWLMSSIPTTSSLRHGT